MYQEISRKLTAAAVVIFFVPYAQAGTVSIGTASARGDVRVDSLPVKGNATLFDGSVLETAKASADVRLAQGVEIMLSTASKSTFYRDHIVLQQGKTEFAAPKSFQVEAGGLRVTPDAANSRGVVSIKTGNTIEVSALTGAFGVTDASGTLLARVHPGASFALAYVPVSAQPTNALLQPVSGVGLVENDGSHYFINVDGLKYEIVGKDFKQFVGTKVALRGTMPTGGSTITISDMAINGGSAGDGQNEPRGGGAAPAATGGTVFGLGSKSWLLVGAILIAASGWAFGIYEANQSSSSASRP